MDALSLLVGFAIPWAFGAALVVAANSRSSERNAPWTIGVGWFVGVFLLTCWMRLLSVAGVPFSLATIAAPPGLASVALGAWLLRRAGLSRDLLRASLASLRGEPLEGWKRSAWAAILAWLATRFALLLHEVVVRPLFPWDAWTQWATKARVWFALRGMAPFVSAPEWLSALNPHVYFDAAPHYPATVPLMQTYAALLIGRWDDALVNLPWWITGLALALALYGAARDLRFDALASLAVVWLVLSLPILDTHVALAGYADLPMSAYFTLAALAAIRFGRDKRWQDGALALLLALACITIKNPGRVWVLTILPALLVLWNARIGVRAFGFGLAGVALLIAFLTRTEMAVLGYNLQGRFALSWSALADAYLLFANWNLLWYGVAAVTVLGWRRIFEPPLAPYSVLVFGGLAFLFVGFSLTTAAAWVEDQSTVNRATLHLAPLLVIWMALVYRAWRAAEAAPEPRAVAASS